MSSFQWAIVYQKFFIKWKKVKARNEQKDFSCGFAGYGPGCEKTIFFDDEKQKNNYRIAYGL